MASGDDADGGQTASSGSLVAARLEAWSPWLLIAAVIAYHLPLLRAPGAVIDSSDITKYFVPIHDFARRSLQAGHWPLWNPYVYAGVPFAANPQTMVFYPPSWLYLLVPVVDAHKWLIAGHALLAALNMHLYLRRIGLGATAALAGCLPWTLGGYFAANATVGHLPMIFAMAWLPLILHFYELWLQQRRRLQLWRCGLVVGVQFLAGEPQSSFFTLLLLAVYALWRAERPQGAGLASWLRAAARPLGALTAVGLVAALGGAVQLLPTLEMVRESDRSGDSYAFSTIMSMPPDSLVAGSLLAWSSQVPALWLDAAGVTGFSLNWEFAVYVGIIPLLLASLALGVGAPQARLACRMAPVAVVLMLGSHTPLYRVAWAAVPGLALFRIPARASLLLLWAISTLAAFGMQRLVDGNAPSPAWRRGAVAGLCGAIAVLLAATARGLWRVAPDGGTGLQQLSTGDFLVARPLATLAAALALVWLLARWPPRSSAFAAVALCLVDLFAARPETPLRPFAPERDRSRQIFQALREAPAQGPFRADLAPSHADALAAMEAHVENVNGYWPVSLRRFYAYVHALRGLPASPVLRHQLHDRLYLHGPAFPLRLLNVRFASQYDRARGRFQLVEDPHPPPRAWLAGRVEVVPGGDEALARLRDRAREPLDSVLLERPPRLAIAPTEGSAGDATVVRNESQELQFATRSSRPAYLVISLPFYPGWKATVDGRETPTERADYFLTALPLPAGAHDVVLRYAPWTFALGAAATGLAAALAALLELRSWRRRALRSLP